MRCKTCNYALWNLPARQCPECGAPFKPSEFSFVPNAVRYECPHCAQAYYGTDAEGHLVPREFDCGRCGRRIEMDQMVLQPTEGVKEESTSQALFPWVHRENRSLVSAWFSSVGMALTKPVLMMKTLPDAGTQVKAWTFLLFNTLVVMLSSILPFLLFMIPIFFSGPGGARGGAAAMSGMFIGMGIMVVIGLVVTLLFVPVWGAVAHGLLRLTGPTAGGIGRTMESVCFASGANVLSAIPCFGGYVGPIWWIVSAVLATRQRQHVSGGRASLAIILPPVAFLAIVVTAYIMFAMWAVSASSAAAAQASTAGQAWSAASSALITAQLTSLHTDIQSHAAQHQDTLPSHPLSYLRPRGLSSAELVAASSNTSAFSWQVAGVTLIDFESAEEVLRDAYVAKAERDAGPSAAAVRLADMIFTSQGVTLSTADPDLWLVVCYPDVSANPPPMPGQPIHVLLADGSVESHPLSSLASETSAQNMIRANMGLPPLPDLATVR